MGKLTRFTSNHKDTTSAWLDRAVIINSNGNLPSGALVDTLRGDVPVIEVQLGKRLPMDLTRDGVVG